MATIKNMRSGTSKFSSPIVSDDLDYCQKIWKRARRGLAYKSKGQVFSSINSVWSVGADSGTAYSMQNYGSEVTVAAGQSSFSNPYYFFVQQFAAFNPTMTWFRVRNLPPDNVMPSFSFGSPV